MVQKADDRRAKTWIIIMTGAVACVALVAGVALVTSLAHPGGRPAPRIADAAMLRSGSGFALSGSIGNLTPGITSRLILRVTNRTSGAITVRTVTIKVPAAPVGCPAANLTIDGKRFAGFPPAVTIRGIRTKVPARGRATVRLRMHLARSASNRCQHARFALRYSGFATTVRGRIATFTRLTSFPNPSVARQPVVLVATARARSMTRSRPTGHVTFYRCIDPRRLPVGSPASACRRAVPLGRPAVIGRGRPARLIVTSLRPGSHSIFAKFRPARPGLSVSASTTITQHVFFARLGKASSRRGPAR